MNLQGALRFATWPPSLDSTLLSVYTRVWLVAAAKSPQSCLTLCDPINGSPPGSSVPGILQARTLEWVAISFSNAWKWKVKVKSLGRIWLLATPWIAAHQAPPSMGFSRQEYWSGVPLPSPLHLTSWIQRLLIKPVFHVTKCCPSTTWELPWPHSTSKQTYGTLF